MTNPNSQRRRFDRLSAARERRRGGFTLVEVLVVVVIMVILLNLLIPALQSAREMARRAACASNLHMLHLSWMAYGLDANSWLPGPKLYSTNFIYTWQYQNAGRQSGYWFYPYLDSGAEVYCPSATHDYAKDKVWPHGWPKHGEEAYPGWGLQWHMRTTYMNLVYLREHTKWSKTLRAPARITDPPQCLLSGDLAFEDLDPDPEHNKTKINHMNSAGSYSGANALYIGGEVTWHSELPIWINRGKDWPIPTTFYLPGDVEPPVPGDPIDYPGY